MIFTSSALLLSGTLVCSTQGTQQLHLICRGFIIGAGEMLFKLLQIITYRTYKNIFKTLAPETKTSRSFTEFSSSSLPSNVKMRASPGSCWEGGFPGLLFTAVFPKRTSSAMGFTQRTTTGPGGTTMTSKISTDVSIDARRAVTTPHTSMPWIRKMPSQGLICLKLGICLTSAHGLSFAQWKGCSSPVAPPTRREEHSLVAVKNAGLP